MRTTRVSDETQEEAAKILMSQTTPTKSEIDAMLVRCGLLPQDEAKKHFEALRINRIAVDIYWHKDNRCTGRTTLRIMEALIAMEKGENIRFVAETLRQAQNMTNLAQQYIEAGKIKGGCLLQPRSTNREGMWERGEPTTYTVFHDHALP